MLNFSQPLQFCKFPSFPLPPLSLFADLPLAVSVSSFVFISLLVTSCVLIFLPPISVSVKCRKNGTLIYPCHPQTDVQMLTVCLLDPLSFRHIALLLPSFSAELIATMS